MHAPTVRWGLAATGLGAVVLFWLGFGADDDPLTGPFWVVVSLVLAVLAVMGLVVPTRPDLASRETRAVLVLAALPLLLLGAFTALYRPEGLLLVVAALVGASAIWRVDNR